MDRSLLFLLLTRSPFLVLLSWEKRKGKVSKVEINYSLSSSLLCSIANFYYYDEEYESDWHHSLLRLFSNLFEDAVSGILGPEWLFNNRCSLCSEVCVLLLQIDAQCWKITQTISFYNIWINIKGCRWSFALFIWKIQYICKSATNMMKMLMRHFGWFLNSLQCSLRLLATITWFYQMQSGMKKDLLLSNLF